MNISPVKIIVLTLLSVACVACSEEKKRVSSKDEILIEKMFSAAVSNKAAVQGSAEVTDLFLRDAGDENIDPPAVEALLRRASLDVASMPNSHVNGQRFDAVVMGYKTVLGNFSQIYREDKTVLFGFNGGKLRYVLSKFDKTFP